MPRKTKETPSIGALTDELYNVREQLRTLSAEERRLTGVRDDLKIRLIQAMKALGIEQTRTQTATATFTETAIGQVEDWDAYFQWEQEMQVPYMRERRLAQAAFREYIEHNGGELPPGVKLFTKEDISLRTR